MYDQKNHFCQVGIRNGTSLDPGIENTLMGLEQIEQQELGIGSQQVKTGESRVRIGL